MLNHTTHLIAKIDLLKYFLSKSSLTGQATKWDLILSEFNIVYKKCKAIKGQLIADQLAEAPLQGDHPIIVDFPDDTIMTIAPNTPWKLFFDRSFTQKGLGVGVLFVTPQGDLIPKSYKISFPCTNNIAEYEGLLTGLRQAIRWNIKSLLVFGDSQLVIKQVTDEYHTKDEKLLPYRRIVEGLKQHFTKIGFQQIPRANNKAADAMATIASMIAMPEYSPKCEFLIENLFTPAYKQTDSNFCVRLLVLSLHGILTSLPIYVTKPFP